MKRFCNAFAVLMAALCTASTASALPLVWRADWPDAKPVETLVHRGTDVELQPQWYINKEAADTNGWTFTTFCQTNAVGPWFGPLPGAFFSHTNDVGAAFYNVMVRASAPGGAVNYTAFARLRMLDSPGFAPGELPLPVPFIDFSKVVAINAPWLLPGATNDIGAIKVELGSISNSVSTLSAAAATNSAAIATINSKIPSAASASNQLADKAWIDDEIDTYAAYYITYTAAGAAFPTRAALTNATVVYSGGAARTPTRNDYAVVLADESHGGAEWRYIYTVAAGATSGQWDAQYPIETNDYDGLSNKPQINGNTLTGNKTAAQLDLQSALTAQQLANIDAVSNKLDKSGGAMDIRYYHGPLTANNQIVFAISAQGAYIGFKSGGHTIYINSDSITIDEQSLAMTAANPTAGNLAALDANGNPTDSLIPATNVATKSMIDANNTTFSNAVLSVGIGIDTNTVAAINELVDSAHDLPVTGATSVGALLLALAAAVAALKKRLPYAIVAAPSTTSGMTQTVTLADRANSSATQGSGITTVALAFPAETSGTARDFILALTCGATPPNVTFPAGATIVIDDSTDLTAEEGLNLYAFTEISANTFVASRLLVAAYTAQ